MNETIIVIAALFIIALVALGCWFLGMKWSQEDITDKYFGLPDYGDIEVDGHQTNGEKINDDLC
jgi:hypothetical protein